MSCLVARRRRELTGVRPEGGCSVATYEELTAEIEQSPKGAHVAATHPPAIATPIVTSSPVHSHASDSITIHR